MERGILSKGQKRREKERERDGDGNKKKIRKQVLRRKMLKDIFRNKEKIVQPTLQLPPSSLPFTLDLKLETIKFHTKQGKLVSTLPIMAGN